MSALVLYDAACRALAEAFAVYEVKNVHDQAEAARHAAKIARNKDFEIKSAQLRFRAERRLGELKAALTAIDGGEQVDSAIARHLVGDAYVHATTTRLIITERGRPFLASLVDVPLADQEKAAVSKAFNKGVSCETEIPT